MKGHSHCCVRQKITKPPTGLKGILNCIGQIGLTSASFWLNFILIWFFSSFCSLILYSWRGLWSSWCPMKFPIYVKVNPLFYPKKFVSEPANFAWIQLLHTVRKNLETRLILLNSLVTLLSAIGFSLQLYPKSSTPLWVLFTFLKLCKWYQMVQSVS